MRFYLIASEQKEKRHASNYLYIAIIGSNNIRPYYHGRSYTRVSCGKTIDELYILYDMIEKKKNYDISKYCKIQRVTMTLTQS